MSSRKTVVRAREGDRDAMERLYREYYNDVYRYCVYRCGDLHVGEDLAQETFLRLLRYSDGLEQLKKPKAYIIKVACNVAAAPPPRHRSRLSRCTRAWLPPLHTVLTAASVCAMPSHSLAMNSGRS